jgi:hypothetical protein
MSAAARVIRAAIAAAGADMTERERALRALIRGGLRVEPSSHVSEPTLRLPPEDYARLIGERPGEAG